LSKKEYNGYCKKIKAKNGFLLEEAIMKTSRAVSIILVLLLVFSLFTGCGVHEATEKPRDIANEIKAFADSDIEWIELKKTETTNYFGFTDEKIVDSSVFLDTDEIKNNMIAVFFFEDKESLSKAVEAINKSLANGQAASEDMNKNELVMKKDQSVVVAVLSDNETVRKMLKEKGYR